MPIERLRTSFVGSLVLLFCLFLASCAPKISIDNPQESFSVGTPLADSIYVTAEIKQKNDDAIGRYLGRFALKQYKEKLPGTLVAAGLFRSVLVEPASTVPTLRSDLSIEIDTHPGLTLVKILLIFPPFFMDHTVDHIFTVDSTLVTDQGIKQLDKVIIVLHETGGLFSRGFSYDDIYALVCEDLARKIGLQLKRHPDWFWTATPASTP